MKLRSFIEFFNYKPLLSFVNEPLTRRNWREKLHEVESNQLEGKLGLEASEPVKNTPKIGGAVGSYQRARKLQASIREQLNSLTRLCSDPRRLGRESEDFGRGGDQAWTWRKALVLPTREMFFEDAGEALNFLAEELELDIKQRVKATQGTHTKRDSKGLTPCLHLSFCKCGCGKFFLWEGNWRRKQRKFLDNKHRMDFHNRRNVKRKRRLAVERRRQGDPSYFGIPRKEQDGHGRS